MERTSPNPEVLRGSEQRDHTSGRVADATPTPASRRRHAAGAPARSVDELVAVVRGAFHRVQVAWDAGDLAKVQEAMTPEAYEAMRVALEQLVREGGIYRHFEFQPAAVAITKAWRENARELFHARLTATLRDYVVDDFSGEMASWGWLEPVHVVEEWTFVREAGGLWRVAAVAQVSPPGISPGPPARSPAKTRPLRSYPGRNPRGCAS